MEFERLVSAQCESLIQMIHERREFLIDTIRIDREAKLRTLKVRSKLLLLLDLLILTNCRKNFLLQEQQLNCTGKLQQTTGLIQFCIEALKETDSAAFLQVSRRNFSFSSGSTFRFNGSTRERQSQNRWLINVSHPLAEKILFF